MGEAQGGFRPETNPRGRLSCTQKEGESGAISEDDPPAGEGARRRAREMSSSNRGRVYRKVRVLVKLVSIIVKRIVRRANTAVLSRLLLRGEMSY